MPAGSAMMCHLVPIESFAGRISYTPQELEAAFRSAGTLSTVGYSIRPNFDGIVISQHGDFTRESRTWVQVYRNGIVELVAGDMTFTRPDDPAKTRYLRRHYEQQLVEKLLGYLEGQKALGMPLPIWYSLTLTGMKGVTIGWERDFSVHAPIDRDILWLPPIEITDYSAGGFATLKPLFDVVWNAADFPSCLSFDQNGVWQHQ